MTDELLDDEPDAGADVNLDVDEPSGAEGAPIWAKVGTLVVGLVLVGFVALLATREGGTSQGRGRSQLIGHVVPELGGRTLDGGTFDIDDARGSWTVLNFFASWCIPCAVEHPEFVEISERTGDDRIQVVSVTMGDKERDTAAFFAQRGGDWPVIVDAASAAARFVVLQVPETFLLTPNGVVVAKWNGEVTAAEIVDAIAEIKAIE